jgi:D-arabinose 1-dehydrogenase-like Zn-dependent alcohol dehydrogenase
MKAVRLVEIGRPLRLQEVEPPPLGEAEARVRVRAAGICHSDAHYRSGRSPVGPLPLTPGHEVAGVVEEAGAAVADLKRGDRVCLHYLVTCGRCEYCLRGQEQFCVEGYMIGKHRDGGYAESITLPARNAVRLPDSIPFEHGAVMMCSSATSLHALRKARLAQGERVAVFGAGGLGFSAVQLALALGALEVYAVDIRPEKLQLAARLGAVPVDASTGDPADIIRRLTGGRGVDVALELVGLPLTMRQAVQCLAVFGRAAAVGITDRLIELDSYREVQGPEAELIGSSDHLLSELPLLLELARRGKLDLSAAVERTVPLDPGPINAVLDDLDAFRGAVRTVIVP